MMSPDDITMDSNRIAEVTPYQVLEQEANTNNE